MTADKTAPALRERAERYQPEAQPDLCRSGKHDLGDPANTIRHANGTRQCRSCRVEASRRYRERKAEELRAYRVAYWDEHEREHARRRYATDPEYAERRRQYDRDRKKKLKAKATETGVCAHGHDLTEPGAVYVRPNGTKRECVACRRDQRRRWRETHPDQQRAYQRAWMRRYRAQQKES